MKFRRLFFACVAAMTVTCAFAQERRIQKIAVEGNKKIERDAILSSLKTKAGAPLNSKTVSDDVKTIFGLGYFKDVRASFDPEKGVLTWTVIEKTTIREIKFTGNDEEDTEDLQKVVQIKAFSYLDDNKIREDVGRLKGHYDSKGYYLADIESVITELPNNEAKLTFKIQENRKVKVERITFIGNKIFSSKELKGVIRTKEKGFLSFLTDSGAYREEMFAQDRQMLRDYYGHHGYIKTKIGSPRVQLAPDKRSLVLTVTLEEGERYKTGNVSIEGELIKPKEELAKSAKLKEGEWVDTLQIQKDIQALTTIYADQGYAYANVLVKDQYDEKQKVVDITYFLQPGQKVWIEKIRFSGNSSTRDKVLRREMQIREGDLYNLSKISQSKQNIDRLSLYEEVRLSTPRGTADDRVDIAVEIKEKSTGTFSVGAGFNTLESFQIIGQVQKRNLFGYGVDIALQARIGGRTQAFNLQYRDEHFLDSYVGMTVNAFIIDRKYSDFDQTSRGGTLGYDYLLYQKALQRVRVGTTYKLVDEELSDIRSTVEELFEGGLTSSLEFSLSRDTRNRVFEPSKGSFMQVSEEVAGSLFGGDNNFTKTEFDGRWFFPVLGQSTAPIVGDSVFALHLGLGFVAPLHDNERVPLFERYFPGGILSLRGFQLRSLGPDVEVASNSDPSGFTTTPFHYGGNKQVLFNAEYIYNIIKPAQIKGVFFFDMGNAFDNGESLFTLTGQRQSVGFGIRWFSPIGPLRFEWGFPLDRQEDESFVVFDFTIGSLF